MHSIAKDISLFSAVLKGLSSVLEKGQQSRLHCADAYKTSLLIVEECKKVFAEIETILHKTSKVGRDFDSGRSLDGASKFIWFFRKSQVQVLRSNLD